MTKIKNYSPEHYDIIKSWWQESGMQWPRQSMLPQESTFVVEADDKPIMAVTLYMSNSKDICQVDNLISDPNLDKETRRKFVGFLQNYIEFFAKGKGYTQLTCLTEKTGLKKRYKELGYIPTLSNVTTFVKEL